jgi:Secretion system C-terminal sorting domain
MKNKILLVIAFLITLSNIVKAQQERVQATIAQTSPNSMMVKLKPSQTFAGQITAVVFNVQIPTTVSPQPVVSIKNNPLIANIPTYITPAGYIEAGFYNYIFSATTVGSPVFNFTNGVEVNALEIQFVGATGSTGARLAHLPDGGTVTFQAALYVEVAGEDQTNYTSLFYGSGAVNGGSISTYSFVPLSGGVVPVKFTSFSATKKDNDALLSWVVENETSLVTTYEVERSIDGIKFDKINTIAKSTGANNIYNTTDPNLSAIKNSGIIYYRIKQMDINGEFVYSNIQNVRLTDKGTLISAFPNPATEFTTVKIDVLEAADATISLINADGKQLQTTTLKAAKGLNLKKIDMNNLPKGDYLLKVTLGTDVQTIKVVKL